MLIRHLHGSRCRDLRVSVADPDATVADLAAALDPERPAGPLLVDGRLVPAATPLDRAGVAHGAAVTRPPDPTAPAPPPAPPVSAQLTVTTGPDAGRSLELAPGAHLVGRADGAPVRLHDPTVSAEHATLDVRPDGAVVVADLGSTNGTWLGHRAVRGVEAVPPGVEVRCGASRFTVGPSPRAAGGSPRSGVVGSARTRPRHRAPRAALPEPPPPVALPPEPGAAPPVTPVGLVAVAASLAAGGAAVLLLHSWTYAGIALLGPVMLVANGLDSRRRRRTHRRRAGRRRSRELAALGGALDAATATELARRRVLAPGAAVAVADALAAAPTCWERRPHHADAFAVRIGVGRVAWEPPVEPGPGGSPTGGRGLAADVAEVLAAHAGLPDAPVVLRLEPGRPVAVVGPAAAGRDLVRSVLVQATVAHGPADLRVAVLAAPTAAATWDWAAWLPHGADVEAGSLLAGSEARAQAVLEALAPRSATGADTGDGGAPRTAVVVIDDADALAARRSAARSVLRLATDPGAGLVPVVLVADPAQVPAACRLVLTVGHDATVAAPDLCDGPAAVVGVPEDVAREAARALAAFDDPELDDPGLDLPATVALGDLLGAERLTAAGMVAAWRAAGADPAPRAVLGTSADGPFVVDLAVDGPHALVAGTTGAGKSELLRTLVGSLAAASSPRHLTFVLIDFKGGSAFDACARLPHVTGLVTDLDDHLAARALRCLHAELRHREQRLRAAGAEDLAELRRREPDGEPLPRLVVVVDEFATLAAELPDFVDSLVGVAQRGRSLGVHLVLATQRPSGAVSERIRANTALRVALRVHDAADSTDVVDAPGAASLPRRRPGRALVRLGPGELVAVQVARSTTPATTPAGPEQTATERSDRAPVAVQALRVAGDPTPARSPEPRAGTIGPTDLDVLVDAATAAWARVGHGPPRRPWPEPLAPDVPWPVAIPLARPTPGPALVLGVADHPERQRHEPWCWHLDQGPLLAVGLPGSGTTTLAATVVLEAARTWDPARCHVHVVDLGAGVLEPLAGLPHVGAVIGADDLERQRRLVADLTDDLARRRARHGSRGAGDGTARRVVVIDGLGGFRARWPDLDPSGTWDRLLALAADGSTVGIHVVLVAEGLAAAPHRVAGACAQRLAFRLGEPADHAALGIPASAVPHLPPGRALAAEGPRLVQVARPADGLAAAVARLAGRHRAAAAPDVAPVGRLPEHVARHRLGPAGARPDGSLSLPVGLADDGLVPVVLRLGPGAHAVVAGPPRSGRTSALLAIGRAALDAGAAVVAVAAEPGPWVEAGLRHHLPTDDLADLLATPGPLVVLVDDADRTPDDHAVLRALAAERRPDRHVVAAARPDRLRSAYGHWTRELRADRTGLLLAPDPDLDGDLLGTRVPRHLAGGRTPGRGWACGTHPEGLVQVAAPDPAPDDPAVPL